MITLPQAPAMTAILNAPAPDQTPSSGPCQSPGCDGLPTQKGFGDMVLCDDCWHRLIDQDYDDTWEEEDG